MLKLRCVAALDHSDLCTNVYKHNHHHHNTNDNNNDDDTTTTTPYVTTNTKNVRTMNIEKLTLPQMEKWVRGGSRKNNNNNNNNNNHKNRNQIDIWAMSPPCQPHTRQHGNQDADLQDPRSASFLHLCQLLESTSNDDENLPSMILVENVIGFETSNSCQRFRTVLSKHRYSVGHFHVNPTQVGLPNDRPRYYCVAVRKQQRSPKIQQQSSLKQDEGTTTTRSNPLQKYLKLESIKDECEIQTQVEELNILPPPPTSPSSSLGDNHLQNSMNDDNSIIMPTIESFLDPPQNNNNNNIEQDGLKIPEKVLNSNAAWCFDIVTPDDNRTSCFTSAYGKYVRGTGSVLYFGKKVKDNNNSNNDNSNGNDSKSASSSSFHPKLLPPEQRQFDSNWSKGLDLQNNMRYFSGTEMARLFDFRTNFQFPPQVTTKQQWKLIGNSLNVRVASKLCELGLEILLSNDDDTTENAN